MAKGLTIKSDHHCGVFLIEAWGKYKFLETAENRANPQKAMDFANKSSPTCATET